MDTAQNRAVRNYRKRLNKQGMARFEVLGRKADRALIRALARHLAEDAPDSLHLRDTIAQTVVSKSPAKGGILAALRRSPLVGADLDISRARNDGRKIDI